MGESALVEDLPQGWRRMEAGSDIFYLHSEGAQSRQPPLRDSTVPAGWSKFECKSWPGKHYFLNNKTGKNVWSLPKPEEELPLGWQKRESRSNPGKWYYLHVESGATQVEPPTSQRPAAEVESQDDLP